MSLPGGVGSTVARLRDYLSLVRFSHTIFALPFALIALLVATRGRPSPRLLALVVLAAVCARTAAMAYNRYVDREIDARNPRTAHRELPRGAVSPRSALVLAVVSAGGFVGAAAALGDVCLWASPVVLLVLLGYSHTKRFTALSHFWLGAALGLAPLAAWVAARGRIGPDILVPGLLGLGVLAWVAGFDVLYACQDDEFDAREGLHSLPVRLGRRRALAVARLAHVAAVALFVAFGLRAGLGAGYAAGAGVAAVLLVHEHRLIGPEDLSNLDTAFFTMNGLVSLVMLVATMADLWVI